MKPTGGKNYGSIGHLPNSRLGRGDHKVPEGMAAICCEKKRDKHDRIIVQEKLDGSNVGVAKVSGEIIPLTRAGYIANTSPYEQHHKFYEWALSNAERFDRLLVEGERIVGEWLAQAHGTRYKLPHEPFVAFDIMTGKKRVTYETLRDRATDFVLPKTLSVGDPIPVDEALEMLGEFGAHGALDKIEGIMYRVERANLVDKRKGGERKWVVDFLAKFVRKDKQDGCYLESVTGRPTVWNEWL